MGGHNSEPGAATSEIMAHEVVTSPTMISCKHPQGGPRPPNMPLQELTQELSSGTKQVMLRGCHTLLSEGGSRTPESSTGLCPQTTSELR